jgi:hypothetical protein
MVSLEVRAWRRRTFQLRPWLPLIIGVTVGLAGVIQLALLPIYLLEQAPVGIVFTLVALGQLTLAVLLVRHLSSQVFRIGVRGAGGMALGYILTRLIPSPTIELPDVLTTISSVATAVATGLTYLAVIVLLLASPAHTTPPGRVAACWWGWGGALLTAPLWLIAVGIVQWTSIPLPAPSLVWYAYASPMTPALVGPLLPHLWLFAPWWTLIVAGLLSILVGVNLWLTTRLIAEKRLSEYQRRLVFLMLLPASLAGPLCCGASLATLVGIPSVVSLALAPYVSLVSLVLLAGQTVLLTRRLLHLPTM